MKNLESNITGFSRYHISKLGTLYSNWSGRWKVVKPVIKNTGYVSNNLKGDDGNRYNLYRHRLVAMVYISNPGNLPQVCHRDNNPTNNHVNNLYWGTPKANIKQCINDHRFYFVGKERRVNIDVKSLIEFYELGIPRKEILDKFGISVGFLYKILKANHVKLRKSR